MSCTIGSNRQPDSWLKQFEDSANRTVNRSASLSSDIDSLKDKACSAQSKVDGEAKEYLENFCACLSESFASASCFGLSCKATLETVSAIQLGNKDSSDSGLEESKAAAKTVKEKLAEVQNLCGQCSVVGKDLHGKLAKAIGAITEARCKINDEVKKEQENVTMAEQEVNMNDRGECSASQKQEADKMLQVAIERAEKLRVLSIALSSIDVELRDVATKAGDITSDIEKLRQQAQGAIENTETAFGLQVRYGKSLDTKDREIERLKALLARSQEPGN